MAEKKERELTEQEQASNFLKGYEALCQKYGFNITVIPAWKPTSHGSWELVLQSSIGRIPQQIVEK